MVESGNIERAVGPDDAGVVAGDDAGWAWFAAGQVDEHMNGGDRMEADANAVQASLPRNGEGLIATRDVVWQRVLGLAGGADGAAICAQLRAMTLERALGPAASPQAIWMLEGQRALVLQILRRAGVSAHG
ncbi:hypothetical protein [Thalassospira marina]|uniref:Bbp19-like phage domain-containing protein n=1 Tax=Thalassospira marina TaxID=2048283 RepID=A0A2N3KZN7_9PROT|nr:hypothetical protein [Thalassospira marina]PKR56035.1 hypothetical protein COO20_02160 [Thalassospira marina]